MTINEFDKWLCDNYHIHFKMDGSDFNECYRNGWVYIITFESGNAYRVFTCDNDEQTCFGIQELAEHYFSNGRDYGYDEPCDVIWFDCKVAHRMCMNDIQLHTDSIDEWPALAKKWFDKSEADGLFTETINE